MVHLHVDAGMTTVVKDMERLLPFQCGKCGRWKSVVSMTFFTLVNLGIQGGSHYYRIRSCKLSRYVTVSTSSRKYLRSPVKVGVES
jgi:hypothetical protein